MIVTASIVHGLQVVTGPLIHHLALMIAMFTLSVPDECHTSSHETDSGFLMNLARGKTIYGMILLMHLFNAV